MFREVGQDGGKMGQGRAHAPPELSEPAITRIRLFSILGLGEGEGMVSLVWDRRCMSGGGKDLLRN